MLHTQIGSCSRFLFYGSAENLSRSFATGRCSLPWVFCPGKFRASIRGWPSWRTDLIIRLGERLCRRSDRQIDRSPQFPSQNRAETLEFLFANDSLLSQLTILRQLLTSFQIRGVWPKLPATYCCNHYTAQQQGANQCQYWPEMLPLKRCPDQFLLPSCPDHVSSRTN